MTLLLHARKLIGQGWTQHADGRDGEEQAVEPWSPHAVAWSLLGALVASLEAEPAENDSFAVGQLAAACAALAAFVDHDLLEAWNDDPTRTQVDVLDALDRAAAHAADMPMSDL